MSDIHRGALCAVLTYSGPLFIAAEEQLQVPVFKLLLQNRQAVIRKVAAVLVEFCSERMVMRQLAVAMLF